MTQPSQNETLAKMATALADLRASLATVDDAVSYMAWELEGQDRTLVIEMFQAMLNDLIEHSALKPMTEYVRRYCDVIDSPADAERIAGEI